MAVSDYYSHTTYPATGAFGSSSGMRAELEAIENGLSAKLPDLAGNGGEIVAVNAGATALEAITTTGTGSGVRATSPSITTPVLSNMFASAVLYRAQTAPVTYSASGTVLSADILDGIIRSSGGTPTLTLPTGEDLAAAASSQLSANRAFDFSVIHVGAGTATIAVGASGWNATIVGSATIATGESGLFRVRCTAAATYTLYRLA